MPHPLVHAPLQRAQAILIRLFLSAAACAAAAAQVTPIGPFAGPQFEGFETQHSIVGGQHPASGAPFLAGGLFGGTATLNATSSPFIIQVHGGTSAVCSASHRTGSFQVGVTLCEATLLFDTDQAAFGGYFASDTIDPMNSSTREWEAEFLDALGMPLGTGSILLTAPCGDYQWAGWILPQGTRRIDFSPAVQFMTLIMDDLVASPVTPIGEVSCMPAETSVDQRAQCRASGSAVAASNALTLHASRLPASTFGFFIASRTQAFIVGPGGSAGNLCLGGAIGRYIAPGQIQNSGVSGAFSLAIDLTAVPQPNGPVAAVSGERWYFQAWFRDVTTPGIPQPTSNFTSALAITFE